MLDSSVWISLFVRDMHKEQADQIFKKLMKRNVIILVPMIIYAEVMNNIIKLNQPSFEKEVKMIFNNTDNIMLLDYDYKFWHEHVLECARHAKLRALDLLIITSALLFKVDELYTFDIKMETEYNKIIKSQSYA